MRGTIEEFSLPFEAALLRGLLWPRLLHHAPDRTKVMKAWMSGTIVEQKAMMYKVVGKVTSRGLLRQRFFAAYCGRGSFIDVLS